MEQGYEFTLTHHRRSVLEQADINALYIPLKGKHTTNVKEKPFDLAEKIRSFFVFDEISRSEPKVMLLMGDTGSGKSMFSQQLYQQLWSAYKTRDPIPLWIPLPELESPFEGAVEEVLTKYGFHDKQIAEMKANERFIFVLDGYDELHQFQNCYVLNKWHQWNAKVLITCRSQALYYQKDPDKYFMPFNGEKRLPVLLRKLYVVPFSKEQISAYVKKYQQLNTENKISEEDFSKVPGLMELISTPFLLHLAVEALPDILTDQVDNEKMTQAKLYDFFIERWFTRQVRKLEATGQLKDFAEKIKHRFWDYCKRLAQQMHANEVTVIPYRQQKAGGRLFGKEENKNIWEPFFSEDTEILRSACPMKRMGDHHYGFIHASFVEYFAMRAMYEEIQEELDESEDLDVIAGNIATRQTSKEPGLLRMFSDNMIQSIDTAGYDDETEAVQLINRPKGGIHFRVFAKEPNGMQNLADRIIMKESFKKRMIKLVESSKHSERYAIGAANAITALVKAGVSFNGADLSGVNISGSDISGGYFDHVNFCGSSLNQVQMARAWLRQSNLQKCQFHGISFGEYPSYSHDEAIICIVYHPELSILAAASCNKVIFWKTDSYDQKPIKVVKSFEEFEGIRSIAISRDGKNLFIGGGNWKGDNSIRVLDLTTDSSFELVGHNREVDSVHISDDGATLISGGMDGSVRVWEMDSRQSKILQDEGARVKCVHLSADKSTLASGNFDYTVKVWNMLTGDLISILEGHTDQVFKVHLNGNGTMLASCGVESTIRVWNITQGTSIVLNGHRYGVNDVRMSEDGSKVVSGGDDGTVRIWDIAGRSAKIIQGHTFTISCVYLSDDGKTVASGGEYDKTIRIWKIDESDTLISNEYLNEVNSVYLSLEGKTLIAGTKFNIIKVWDIEKNLKRVLRGHTDEVKSVKLTLDCNTVVSGSEDTTIRVWNLASGKSLVLQSHTSWVNSIDLSYDGNLILSGSEDTTIRMWNLNESTSKLFEGHKKSVHCVRLSADQKMFISGGSDYTVRVWYIDGRETIVFSGHTNTVKCVDLNENNTIIVSGSDDKTIRIWKIASGECTVLTGHDKSVTGIQLSENGLTILSTSIDNTMRIWDVMTASVKLVIRLHAFVRSISLQDRIGTFCVGLSDGSTQIWQRIDTSYINWQLKWSSNYPNSVLNLQDSDFRGSKGLSPLSYRITIQHGAKIDSEAELMGIIGQRSGSPLYSPRQESMSHDELLSSCEDTLNI